MNGFDNNFAQEDVEDNESVTENISADEKDASESEIEIVKVEYGLHGSREQPYELVFVKDTSATTCYGCKGKVREKQSAPSPPPPYNLLIRHSERRV